MTVVPRLYLSHDAGLDWLMAYEFGRVDDAQPPDCWRGGPAQGPLGSMPCVEVLSDSLRSPESGEFGTRSVPTVRPLWGRSP